MPYRLTKGVNIDPISVVLAATHIGCIQTSVDVGFLVTETHLQHYTPYAGVPHTAALQHGVWV